jgi:hypothetical protein
VNAVNVLTGFEGAYPERFMNDKDYWVRRQDRTVIFRTAVNPSLGAAGKTSCFSRSGK